MTLSLINLLLGLLLLAVPGYLLYVYDRQMLQKAALAVVRMVVQMTAMGACLWALYRVDSPWLNLLWVVVSSLAATFLVVSRIRVRSRVLFVPVGISMLVGVMLLSAYVLLVVIRPEHALSARWVLPVTGVLTAHLLTTIIPAVRTYFDSLLQDSQPYYTLIGNGATRLQALSPYVTRALRSLFVPALANLSAMGLFVMPMLLSGLLVGGMGAVESVAVYVMLVIAGLVASVVSTLLTLWLADRKVFDRQGRVGDGLRPKERPSV
jgi:putative ABC transport system permease protein